MCNKYKLPESIQDCNLDIYKKALMELSFSMDNINLVNASFIIAKKWGTDENKKYVLELSNGKIDETFWKRRSGRMGITHFIESSLIAIHSIIDKNNLSQDILLKLLLITILHDVVEDSKGLYNFQELRKDLLQISKSNNIILIDDIVEGVKRLTIDTENKTLFDLILKLTPNIDIDSKIITKVNNLLMEYKAYHSMYKSSLDKVKGQLEQNRIIVKDYLGGIRKKELEVLEQIGKIFGEFLSKFDTNQLSELDIIVIFSRLSETITALGPIDIDGFTKGDYAVENLDMKKYFYLPYLEKISLILDKVLGIGTYKKFYDIFDIYLKFAEKYVNAKFDMERHKYRVIHDIQTNLSSN